MGEERARTSVVYTRFGKHARRKVSGKSNFQLDCANNLHFKLSAQIRFYFSPCQTLIPLIRIRET